MKKNKVPTLVTTAVVTLFTIFLWAGFAVYRSLTIKPVPPVPTDIIQPLDPTLDTKALDDISGRTYLDDSQIGNFQVSSTGVQSATSSPSATLAPVPTSTPVATASATP